jgi:peptidoglycan-associated lipoprotein
MNLKIFGAFAALALLAACSTPEDKTTSTGEGASASRSGPAPGSQEDLVASAGDRVFYAFDSSSLDDSARSTLTAQSGWLGRYPQVSVRVEGNADERGTQEYNLGLGQRRAKAARDMLVAKGVSASRINTISNGKEKPVALGSDEQAWAQNRNATTVVR